MRPHVHSLVDRFLNRVAPAGGMDVIVDLAYPLPVTVISALIGVPSADNERIHGWSADFAHSLDAVATPGDSEVVARGRAASQALHAYFRNLVGVRRRDPRADLPPGLLAAEEAGDRLSERELLSTCILLYVAGHHTTVSLIGNGLLALLRHRAQWERLVAERALIPAAVEELLRFDGPVPRPGRMPRVEVQIGSTVIPAGTRLDIGRQAEQHLAFGWRIHVYLGTPLARLETQVVVDSQVRRWPRLRLGAGPIEWRAGMTLQGLRRLAIEF